MKSLLVTLLLTIAFANLIIFAPLWNVSFSKQFYVNEFEKYDVYSKMPYGSEEVQKEFFNTLDYVEGKKAYQTDFFNQKERQHFEDVRDIFSFIKKITLVSLLAILLLIYFLKREDIKIFLDGIMNASVLSLIFIGFIGVMSIFNFRSIFIKMHQLLFSNQLWVMDYTNDKIIRLLPQNLFFDLALRWFSIVFFVSVFLICTAFIIKKYHMKDHDA